jgi:CubicO group peptidase (beta-lactamase class C family)
MATNAALPVPVFEDPERAKKLASTFGEVDELFSRFCSDEQIPGIAYGVVIDGALAHSGGHGLRDVASAAPAGPDSVFRIASMTKSITALCIVALRDEGSLHLDDPVADHVPEMARVTLPTSDTAPITVRQLLTMSAGLVVDDPWGDRQLAMSDADFSALLSDGLCFDFPPGTTYEYSNLGYAILGRVAENISGLSLPELSHKHVLGPLSMSSTTWYGDQISNDVVARGYRVEDGAWVAESPLSHGAFGAMAGVATTVEDFARYVAFHLAAWPPRDGDDTGPVRRSSVREMAQAARSGPTFFSAESAVGVINDGYGYGLVSALHARDGLVVGHSGGLPGFGSHVEWLPDHGVAVMGFANRTYAPVLRAVRSAFDALAGSGALQPRVAPASPAVVAVRDVVVGLYEDWRDEALVAVSTDSLFEDLSIDRRRRAMEVLRGHHGRCTQVGDLRSDGALKGHWRLICETGAIDVRVSLSPTSVPKLQALTMTGATTAPT